MSSYVTRKTPGDTVWFRHDRFGMFIHWGLYAMPARHEWMKNREETPEEKYDKYFKYFDPDLFDAREWARQAKAAGMKYAVLTTKHHEGFCMFDSQYTDYKCTNTPAGRDLVRRTMSTATTSMSPANADSSTGGETPAARRVPAKDPTVPSTPKVMPEARRSVPARR